MRYRLALLTFLLGSPAHAFTEADTHTALSAKVVAGRAVALHGRIEPGSLAVVRAALDRAGMARPTVLVDSPGGSIGPALAIGRLIRARGLSVAVARVSNGHAASAPRQPRTAPTASTTVRASMNSTRDAMKAAITVGALLAIVDENKVSSFRSWLSLVL